MALLCASSALAAFPKPNDVQFMLNHSSAVQPQVQLGTQLTYKRVQVMKAQYDFSKQGGAIGAISLRDMDNLPAVLPGRAVVVGCYIDVVTAPTSAGAATLAFGTGQTAVDLLAATGKASFTAGSILACIPVGSAATAIKLTQAASGAGLTPKLTVATAALTAGKINVLIEYLLSD